MLGRKKLKFLSPQLLEEVAKTENPLVVEIIPGYRKGMITPPIEVLDGAPDGVKAYLAKKSKNTSGTPFDMLHNNTKNVLMFLGKYEVGKTSSSDQRGEMAKQHSLQNINALLFWSVVT